MFARVSTYGIVLAALLMTACSQNETEQMTASVEPVPISFSFTSTQDNQATTRSSAEDAQLRNTGFGVFATVGESEYPNLMYNQQVTFTYLADDDYQGNVAENGYWTYSPVKYWPMKTVEVDGVLKDVPQNVTFGAYAPYVEPADIVGATSGITEISTNEDAPYLIYKRYTNPNDSLNLLWDCQVPTTPGSIKLNMRHALARLAVSIKLEHAPAANTKVLVRHVTLLGTIAESAKLNLATRFIGTSSTEITDGGVEIPTIDGYSGTPNTAGNVVLYSDKKYIWNGSKWKAIVAPMWTDQETKEITIYTDCDPEAEGTWGIIDNDIRYVKDLPYDWQPAGLNATNYQNVITIGSHVGSLYLIPQASLTLNCTVAYTILSSDGSVIKGEKVHNGVVVASPLDGSKSYNLQLRLNL